MFFKLTPEKVIDRINRLIDKLGTYDSRISDYEQQSDMAMRLGIATPEGNFEILEWRAAYDDIYATLTHARSGIRNGTLDLKEINSMLPSVHKALSNFERVLDETDRYRAAGKAAARKIIGG